MGEAVVDVVAGVRRPGGSAVNAAVALARLGHRVRLATALGSDDDAVLVERHLRASGVDLAGDPHVLTRTCSALARVGDDGAATYDFDLDWQLPVAPECSAATTDLLHVCSLGAVLAPGADDVLRLVRSVAGVVPVSYDVNARPGVPGLPPDPTARIQAVARCSTWVRASDEDLALTYPGLPSPDAARRLLSLGPRAVVVTEGAEGARWFDQNGSVHVPAVPAHVVDTIGAGDSFGAALLDALWQQGADDAEPDVAGALAHAARAAAIAVSRPGADPPWRAELYG